MFITAMLWSQEINVRAKGRVSNTDNGANIGGVKITVYHNGTEISSTTSSSNGRYDASATGPLNGIYKFVYTKGGLVTKVVTFDPKGINEEDLPSGNTVDLPLDITLFDDRPNVDFSFLENEPVAEFRWNPSKFIVDYNKGKASMVANKIEKLLDEAEDAKNEIEEKYNKAIAEADAYYDQKKYEDALAKYEEALTYKPSEPYPDQRIQELDALIQAQKEEKLAQEQADAQYNALIEAADKQRDAGEWEKAIGNYELALKEKDEQYPKDQITDLRAKIEAKKKEDENNAAYQAAITKGDMFFKQNSLEAARDQYTEASNLKPSEEYPKKKLEEIANKLKEKEEADALKQKYDDAIAAADAFFDAENFADAKAKYDEALSIEAASTYAKQRSDICAQKLKELEDAKALEEKIAQLMKDGDDAVAAQSYPTAESKYAEILTLDAANEEAKQKLADVKAKIEELKDLEALNAQIEQLMTEGNTAFTAKELETAKGKYEAVLGLKADHIEAKTKLDEVLAAIEARDNAEALEEQINKLLSEGQTAFDGEQYTDAKSKYEQVLGLDSENAPAKTKLAEVNAKLAELDAAAELSAKIEKLLQEGNSSFTSEDYTTAKSKFEEVLSLDSANQEAKDKLAEIETKLGDLAAAKEKEEKIAKLLAEGLTAFNGEDYTNAKSKYEEVLTLDSANDTAKTKISEIEALLAAQDAAAAKEAKIKSLLSEAKTAFDSEELELAKSKYNEVLGLDSENQEAKDGLMQITQLEKELAELANKIEAFNTLVKEGDDAMGVANYDLAITKFEQALEINVDATVQSKLDKAKELKNLAADAAAMKAKYDEAMRKGENLQASDDLEGALEQYQLAKSIDPSQSRPQEKIDEVNALIAKRSEDLKNAQLQSYIDDGKSYLMDGNFIAAKEQFEKAKELDPSNTEVIKLLEEVKEKIDQENAALADAAKFDKLKSEGFTHAANEEYSQAKVKLNEALLIKDDAEIRSKLEEIKAAEEAMSDAALNEQKYKDLMNEARMFEGTGDLEKAIEKYQAASDVKPEEVLPGQKINELKAEIARLKKVDEDYTATMAAGENLMKEEKYTEAISKFNEALSYKPTEKLPVERAAEAERLAALNNGADAAYEKIISTAQEKFEEGDYDRAKELANRALTLKPEDTRPTTLLKQIENALATQAAYDAKMKEADTKAAASEFAQAKALYLEAGVIKPTESLPGQRAQEMQAKLDELASEEQRDQLYNDYMRDGDSFKDSKQYDQALSSYQNALNIKKGDITAQNRINEVQQLIDELSNANAADAAKRAEFDALIKQADGEFANAYYLPAKSVYEKALAIDPSSLYAKKQIEECIRLESERSSMEAEKEYRKIIDAADKNFNKADYDKAKEYYNRALSLKSTDPYPVEKLAEIESILNPSLANSDALEDLGDPYDNTLMDGQALLEQAEQQRKLIKGVKVKNAIDDISTNESKMTLAKTADHLDNSNEIYRVQQLITRDDGLRDLNRQALVDALRASEIERENNETVNVTLDHATNVGDMETLEMVNREVAMDYGDRTKEQYQNADEMELFNRANALRLATELDVEKVKNVNADQELTKVNNQVRGDFIDRSEEQYQNADEMEKFNRANAKRLAAELDDERLENVTADQELTKIQLQVQGDYRDDYESREEARELIFDTERKATDITVSKETENHTANVKSKGEINKIEEAVTNRVVEDAKKAGENNQKLVKVESDVNATELRKAQEKEEHLDKTDRQIRDVQIAVQNDAVDRDNDRLETVELIKRGNQELAEANYNSYNEEMVKYVANKNYIESEVTKNNGVEEKAAASHDRKIAYINQVDKKAQVDYQENLNDDELARLRAKQDVENVYQDAEENTKVEIEKRQDNTDRLNDLTKTMSKTEANQNLNQQSKHAENAVQLDKISDKPVVTNKVANELGEEYPEGVSQENFTRNDNNGLLAAVVTRRIVVIDGHADVYVRTQTSHGTTYTKNGKPTLEHVWNTETQDPSLERHF